jgi:hypothetical protein
MPWGSYWNLCRYNEEKMVRSEVGASFLFDYGIRIINSANGFTAFNITKPHETGSYYHGLTQVGLSLLFGRSLSCTWQKYQKAIESQNLVEKKLLWCDASDQE